MPHSRRHFIRDSSLGVLTFLFAGCDGEMTPEAAHEAGVPLTLLNAAEAKTLQALTEILLPGSAAAGLVEYVDHQLAAPVSEQMLMIKYLGVNPPFSGFYQAGLAALEAVVTVEYDASFSE